MKTISLLEWLTLTFIDAELNFSNVPFSTMQIDEDEHARLQARAAKGANYFGSDPFARVVINALGQTSQTATQTEAEMGDAWCAVCLDPRDAFSTDPTRRTNDLECRNPDCPDYSVVKPDYLRDLEWMLYHAKGGKVKRSASSMQHLG